MGSSPRLLSRRSSLISIEHAELLSSTPLLVLCCAWLVTSHCICTVFNWVISAHHQLQRMMNEEQLSTADGNAVAV